jgi:L-histidine N-alpha-methyltransferase
MPEQATEPRVRIDVLLTESDRRAVLDDWTFWSLRATPKELPAVWLYDEVGSLLFEEITRLPEYYPTAAEREILTTHSAEIATRSAARTLVELGAGTSEKTRLLLDALQAAGSLERFVPLDASEEVLQASAYAIAAEYPTIGVHAIVGDFERHLGALPPGDDRLIAFLGSTIGNLDPARRQVLLRAVAAQLGPGDSFLLGVDLVKDPAVIVAAYNDPQGITERFVRNGLTVVNRELQGDFRQERFAFESHWDSVNEWMDIGFNALEAHTVRLDKLEIDVPFVLGERLRLEISAKFRLDGIERELDTAGLATESCFTDGGQRFALLLARRGY